MINQNEKVVNGIRTRLLHGKGYIEVSERIRIVHELRKDFEIMESAPMPIGDRLLWRIVIKLDGKQYIGHSEVNLDAAKNTPEGLRPFECAETSALGRALGFAGFGNVESIVAERLLHEGC